MAFDQYTKLPAPEVELQICPCCGSTGELWQFQAKEDAPASKVIMCSNGERFAPQDGVAHEGCPLYMPDDGHYRATIREAAKFWNEYAKALTALQRVNRWKSAQVLRQDADK